MTDLPTEKPCGICGDVKRADQFYRQREPNGTYRLKSYCIPCENDYQREQKRHRYRTNPEYREGCLARERKRKRLRTKEHAKERAMGGTATRHYLTSLIAAGWRQAEIARAVQVSRSTMSEWVRGEWTPRYHRHIQALRQFAEATIAGKVAPPVRSQRPRRS